MVVRGALKNVVGKFKRVGVVGGGEGRTTRQETVYIVSLVSENGGIVIRPLYVSRWQCENGEVTHGGTIPMWPRPDAVTVATPNCIMAHSLLKGDHVNGDVHNRSKQTHIPTKGSRKRSKALNVRHNMLTTSAIKVDPCAITNKIVAEGEVCGMLRSCDET